MSTPTIDLHAADSFTIDDRLIHVSQGDRQTRYVIPGGARISLWEGVNGRATLEVGGHKTVTVRITGKHSDLHPLYMFLI